MNKTKIDWPDLDYTWNPIMGCAHGCAYCYAKDLNHRFQWIKDWSKPQFFPERLQEPWKKRKKSTIFVGSMCDIFSPGVEPAWVQKIIDIAALCRGKHNFMFLTKNPGEYSKYIWSDNCMLGATVEHTNRFNHIVRFTEASLISEFTGNKSFLSIEPLMGSFAGMDLSPFSLVIVGAMTGKNPVRPEADWIKSIVHPNIHWKANIKPYLP